MTPGPKIDEFFFVNYWGPKPPGNPSELFFSFQGFPMGPLSKNPKIDVFRPIISAPIGPGKLKFFVVSTQTMLNKMQYTTWAGLVWFGLIQYMAKILKNRYPENTPPKFFDFFGLKALS